MSFDREAALKSAEKAIRQGRVDVAVSEYLRIVEAQPRDWNSANALGDLYVKSKQVDKGIEQYTRIADHLAAEGFLLKAAALYKKILKFKPDQEYALLQSAEISAKQGLLADAKTAFRSVAERRRTRGDAQGAAETTIRIGQLDPEDLEARLAGAKAALDIKDSATALSEFREVAFKLDKVGDAERALQAFRAAFDLDPTDWEVRERLLDAYLQSGDLARARDVAAEASQLKRVASALESAGKIDDSLDVLGEVAVLDPNDVDVLVTLARTYVAKKDPDRARTYFNAETAGRNAALWLTLADLELTTGRMDEGRAAVAESLRLDPGKRDEAMALGRRLADQSPEAGFPCLDAVADAALEQKDYAAAATALGEFTSRSSNHIVALMRLVEVCVDGGLEESMHDAQAQLADAYLASGRWLEARIISEDLVAREPWNTANIDRFRTALVELGESDPDSIIAERLSGESPFLATDKLDLNEGVFFDDPKPTVEAPPPAAPASASAASAADEDEDVIDLDEAIFAEPAAPTPAPAAATPAPAAPAATADGGKAATARTLTQVFKDMRDEVDSGSEEEAAAEQFSLAQTYRELGMTGDAIEALKTAVKSPRQRFDAACLLGTMHLERDELQGAIEWFERAAEVPAPSPAAGRGLMYDLANTLEKSGELSRALAVFVELEAESGNYRDVAYRILRLSKLQAKE
jgi:tetratricopeptide (TPR) repeat protein